MALIKLFIDSFLQLGLSSIFLSFHPSFAFLGKEQKFSSWFWEKLRAKGLFVVPVALPILAGKQTLYSHDLPRYQMKRIFSLNAKKADWWAVFLTIQVLLEIKDPPLTSSSFLQSYLHTVTDVTTTKRRSHHDHLQTLRSQEFKFIVNGIMKLFYFLCPGTGQVLQKSTSCTLSYVAVFLFFVMKFRKR